MGTVHAGARVYVSRDNANYARWRKLHVWLDGANVGDLKRGQTKSFNISPGQHELFVQMDWVKSEPVAFECSEAEEFDALCTSPGFSASLTDIFFISIWERASRPFTVTLERRTE